MPLDPSFLSILACPACEDRPPLREADDTLICDRCGRIYQIRDGIPDLLPEDATLPEDRAPAE